MITFQQARKYFEARLGPLAHRAEVSLRCRFTMIPILVSV